MVRRPKQLGPAMYMNPRIKVTYEQYCTSPGNGA